MNLLDVNVLVALYRPSHPHHELATRWFTESLHAGEPFTVPDVVWIGFLRLVTNRRVFPVPATVEQAWSFVVSLRRQGAYLEFAPHPNALTEFAHIALRSNASLNLVTDAYIAASAVTLGARVVTFDRDSASSTACGSSNRPERRRL